MKSNIHLADTDAQIDGCYAVMQQLRPHINGEDFLSRIRLQQASGYRLAYTAHQDKVVAVAGFRIGENLACGRFLYIDDLVTNADCRFRCSTARCTPVLSA